MEWPSLLASTARLLDLHDCDRAVGATVFTPKESRPGSGTGIWLDVATWILQYIYEKDLESNDAWVAIETAIEALTERHGISRDDVLFVFNYLATPTRLITLKDDGSGLQRQTHKRETSLIEWPSNTHRRDRCRLTAAGSRAIMLSQAAQSWLYAADDASKIVRAIEYGAFVDIPPLCEELIAQIRRFSKEITLLLERPHLDDLIADFEAQRESYLEVINSVQSSIENATDRFNTKQNKKLYLQWLETDDANTFTPYTILSQFKEVLQAIERLNRKFQNLVSVLASSNREAIGLIRFDEAAIGLAFYPCSDEIIDLCISTLGPWHSTITAPVPSDFIGILSLQEQEKSTETRVFDEVAEDVLPSPIERFLNAYREQILLELQKGPIPLGQAIEKGWMTVGDFDALSQLIGIYSSPTWLDENNRDLALSIQPGALNATLPDGSRLEGDEIILHWLTPDTPKKVT